MLQKQFYQALNSNGIAPAESFDPKVSGQYQRFKTTDDKGGNPSRWTGWYRLYDWITRKGERIVTGSFGDFRHNIYGQFSDANAKDLSDEDKEKIKRDAKLAKERAEKERKAWQEIAKQKAEKIWERAYPADPLHWYLQAKKIKPYGIRQRFQTLFIPIYNPSGKLVSVEFIQQESDFRKNTKDFLKGGEKSGCFMLIGEPNGLVYIAEGYATACTIHQVTGRAVFVAFDCGNLLAVGKAVAAKYPGIKIVFAADNDTTTPNNPGINKAQYAAQKLNAQVVIPQGKDNEKVDFNDIAVRYGLEEAAKQLSVENIDIAPAIGELFEKCPTETKAARTIYPHLESRFAWDSETKDWHEWQGNHWANEATESLNFAVHDIIVDMVESGASKRYIENVAGLTKRYLPFPKHDQAHLMPFANCIMDFLNNQMLPHAPDYGFLWCLPYEYDPNAKCPKFLNWLDQVTDKSDARKMILQAYINAIIKGRADLQVFVELIGKAGSGKSTLINVCSALVGNNNTVTTELKQLEVNKFETANLYGKRLAIITDSGRYGGDVDTLKALVGGDTVRLEKKNQQQGPGFRFSGMVLIAANEPIKSTDYSSGFVRRRIRVDFNKRIKAKDRSLSLEGELIAEAPGILNWALQMTDAEVKAVLHGDMAEYAKRIAMVESNPLATWMDESLIYCEDARLRIGTKDTEKYPPAMYAYPNYCQWCEEHGYTPITSHRFSRNVDDLAGEADLDVLKGSDREGSYVLNLKLRTANDTDEPLLSGMRKPNCDSFEGNVKDCESSETPVGDGLYGSEAFLKTSIRKNSNFESDFQSDSDSAREKGEKIAQKKGDFAVRNNKKVHHIHTNHHGRGFEGHSVKSQVHHKPSHLSLAGDFKLPPGTYRNEKAAQVVWDALSASNEQQRVPRDLLIDECKSEGIPEGLAETAVSELMAPGYIKSKQNGKGYEYFRKV